MKDKKIALFLAEGFEEVEAITTIDLLRRADLDVNVISIYDKNKVVGANRISVETDMLIQNFNAEDYNMIILPGGMPGTLNLQGNIQLMEAVKLFARQDKWLAAICAAPSIFGELGLLDGKKATSYPGFENKLEGAILTTEGVAVDGKIITSRGVGTAISFALTIIANLSGKEKSDEIANSILYQAN